MDNTNDQTCNFQSHERKDSVQYWRHDFEQQWWAGARPRIEAYLDRIAAGKRGELLEQLLAVEIQFRRDAGETVKSDQYTLRFAEHAERISRAFELAERSSRASPVGCSSETHSFVGPAPDDTAEHQAGQNQPPPTSAPSAARQSETTESGTVVRFGRYRVEKLLGKGGFGKVYLALDEDLRRQVAVKVASKVIDQADADAYLSEARIVATLDHPHIVPVYDVGRADQGRVYVVSKFVQGSDLATRLQQDRPLPRRSADMIATLADALHYAHTRGLVHRDIKPGNILLDQQGQAYLCDFGLALREEQYGLGPTLAGTPAYMSPEQARGEGHLVDGRSDIYSLGVVLYELLTGRRPFSGSTPELLRQVAHNEPRPPRQIDASLAAELERITLKCLAKRASDRYTTAKELAEDLRAFLEGKTESQKRDVKIVPKGLRSFDASDSDFFLDLLPGARDRSGLPDSISFWKRRLEQRDPDQTFRVGLIYGPSGCGKSSLVKAGLLPRLAESVRPVYIEATGDETETRLLAGLRKACPELPPNISLTEAIARLRLGQATRASRKVVLIVDQFEQWLYARNAYSDTQLADALRQCDGGNVQAVVMARDDFWLAVSRLFLDLDIMLDGHNSKLVDLFDLLHARKVLAEFGRAYGRLPDNPGQLSADQQRFLDDSVTGLSTDGKLISVRLALFLEMVKGKPWTPATLKQLGGISGVGVAFLEETFSAQTAPAAHRHHQRAARAVLKDLLPEEGTNIKRHWRSRQQLLEASGYANRERDFADLLRILDTEVRLITPTDVEGVADDGWQVAGVEGQDRPRFSDGTGDAPDAEQTNGDRGIGTADAAADPHRSEPSPDDLPAKSTPAASAEVTIPSLTTQLTPRHPPSATRYFQLTHDYLVPALRDWLTQKQRETPRGRAELRLEERAAAWKAKPENRYLPSLWEYLHIRALTDPRRWSDGQRNMLAQATRFHGARSALGAVVLVALIAIGVVLRTNVARQQEATRVHGLVGELTSAEPGQVPGIAAKLADNPDLAARYLAPLLSPERSTTEARRGQLHARLATVARDPSLVQPLVEELLTGRVTYVLPIRQMLSPYSSQLTEQFRSLLRDEKAEPKRRFHAALALAEYVPASESTSWTDQNLKFVAEQLVASNAEFQPLLREALRPIRDKLLPDLERVFGDAWSSDAQRLSAANALADYAGEDIGRLSRLLAVATPEQYHVLFPIVAANSTPGTIDVLAEIAATLPPEDLGAVERILHGQRRANAAVTLLRLGEFGKILPVFETSDDPEALSQFIFRCRPRSVGLETLLDCLDLVRAAPADRYPKDTRYALLLALGEFTFHELQELSEARRDALLTALADWYANDPSSGVHGAAGWLLRQWGQTEVATRIEQTPVPYSADREWFTLAITVTPPAPSEDASDATEEATAPAHPLPPRTFYYTFIVFPAGEYTIGSVADEPERSPQEDEESRHPVTLTRPFAVLDREITFQELRIFHPRYEGIIRQFKANPLAAGFGPDWYDSIAFCRWLGRQSGLEEADQAYPAPESLDPEKHPREPNPEANWAPRDWPVDLTRRGFRLPTEAEWEIAARAGARTAYGYGSDEKLLEQFGWYMENSGKHVHPSKKLRPSVRGLFDLHGNLYEWTHDWYEDFSTGKVINPIGAPSGSIRVTRGGSWGYEAANCRSAYRNANDPTIRSGNRGFRVALSPSGGSRPGERREKN